MPGIKSGPRAGQGESSKYLLSCLTAEYLEPLVPWESPGEQHGLEQAGAHYLVRTIPRMSLAWQTQRLH